MTVSHTIAETEMIAMTRHEKSMSGQAICRIVVTTPEAIMAENSLQALSLHQNHRRIQVTAAPEVKAMMNFQAPATEVMTMAMPTLTSRLTSIMTLDMRR